MAYRRRAEQWTDRKWEINQKKLTDRRFEHSLGVEYVSGCLAMVHGVNVEKALTAGLLHDCSKVPSLKKRLNAVQRIIFRSANEQSDSELLHAKPWSILRKRKVRCKRSWYLICDRMSYHRKACKMNMLEKILFVADYIEPEPKAVKGDRGDPKGSIYRYWQMYCSYPEKYFIVSGYHNGWYRSDVDRCLYYYVTIRR